jgi:replication-associated recombination protein RarA
MNHTTTKPPEEVLLHPVTQQHIASALQRRGMPVAVAGPIGSGKETLARYIANQALQDSSVDGISKLEYYPGNSKTFTIDTIRRLKKDLSLKAGVSVSAAVERVAILHEAHKMNEEAQNALLKTLEESPETTLIVLTTSDIDRLLPTVRSRVVKVDVLPLAKDKLDMMYPEVSQNDRNKAFYVSSGYVGIYCSIISGDNDHPLMRELSTAKQLLTQPVFDRLLTVEELRKDSARVEYLLHALKLLLRYKLQHQPNAALIYKTDAVIDAERDLRAHVNPRLVLTDLFRKL